MNRPTVQILITLHPDGRIDVAGPVQDKLFCYGLIECAKDVIRDYKPAAIVVPKLQPERVN